MGEEARPEVTERADDLDQRVRDTYDPDEPRSVAASRAASGAARDAAPLLDPNMTFGNQPDGWLVLWCPFCLYAVTWAEGDADTYDEAEWSALRRDASEHACSVEHG